MRNKQIEHPQQCTAIKVSQQCATIKVKHPQQLAIIEYIQISK